MGINVAQIIKDCFMNSIYAGNTTIFEKLFIQTFPGAKTFKISLSAQITTSQRHRNQQNAHPLSLHSNPYSSQKPE